MPSSLRIQQSRAHGISAYVMGFILAMNCSQSGRILTEKHASYHAGDSRETTSRDFAFEEQQVGCGENPKPEKASRSRATRNHSDPVCPPSGKWKKDRAPAEYTTMRNAVARRINRDPARITGRETANQQSVQCTVSGLPGGCDRSCPSAALRCRKTESPGVGEIPVSLRQRLGIRRSTKRPHSKHRYAKSLRSLR